MRSFKCKRYFSFDGGAGGGVVVLVKERFEELRSSGNLTEVLNSALFGQDEDDIRDEL